MDGRDWYQAADGSAFWEDSHEDMIFVGETAYTNVGARYTIYYESSDYSLTFEQNSISSINNGEQSSGKNLSLKSLWDEVNEKNTYLSITNDIVCDISNNGQVKKFGSKIGYVGWGITFADMVIKSKRDDISKNEKDYRQLSNLISLFPHGAIAVEGGRMLGNVLHNYVARPTENFYYDLMTPGAYGFGY